MNPRTSTTIGSLPQEGSHPRPSSDHLRLPKGTYINPLPMGLELPFLFINTIGMTGNKMSIYDSALPGLSNVLGPFGVFPATLTYADGTRPVTVVAQWPQNSRLLPVAFDVEGRPSVYGAVHMTDGRPDHPTGSTNLLDIVKGNLVGMMGYTPKGDYRSYSALMGLDVHWYGVEAD